MKGKVYIIGAGPGDPGLITIKGLKHLQEADVVIYDHLVSEDILRHLKAKVRFIYAGKQGGDHTLTQDEINVRLVEEALKGNVVARLKGGDPFIFGRGGEEAEVLAEAGIDFEIVPGVTSAIAVPAYAGIPLTHRGYTASVAFVTGHEDPLKEKSDIDWAALSRIGTLVFLMGVKNLPSIAEALMANGRRPETPAALIRWGSTPEQEAITGTLADIGGKAQSRNFLPPSILVVGEVVALRESLNWFEKKPLFGKGIVITRPEEQAEPLASLLQAQGARTILFPTIKIVPADDVTKLDHAVDDIEKYQWIAFTSGNGVRFFFDRLLVRRDIRDLKGISICAIGPATAEQIAGRGIRVNVVPKEFISESVVKAFEKFDMKGKRVLLPRAEKARDVIPEGLARMGAEVDVVTAYKTINSGRSRAEIESFLDQGAVDVITFTSPSTVENFVAIMDGSSLPTNVKVACIGPVTAQAAGKAGLRVDIRQKEYTMQGMVETLVDYFRKDG